MFIRTPRGWEIPERLATPEALFLGRRAALRGTSGLGPWANLSAFSPLAGRLFLARSIRLSGAARRAKLQFSADTSQMRRVRVEPAPVRR